MKSVTLKHVLGTTLGVLLFSLSLFAQGSFGRIMGTVTDQTGAVLPGATVTVLDTERGVPRTLTTDGAGEYNAPNLTPGTYSVRVEAKGFKILNRQNVVIEVGKEVRVDLTPQTGDQTQTVTVTESIPLVDTSSATLGGTVSNADINDMPLNGRNYQYLMSLRPGVVQQPGGGPWTQSTNGIRPDETAWMVDGVINATMDAARPIANMSSPLTDAATIMPVDAIQEFNMQVNPKAEYGWKPGAVVNVGIRSGTNSLHGSAYAFGRLQDWDARNLFNPGDQEKLDTTLKQFGAVVGGRIKKDKLFFFGGYEGQRSLVGNPSSVTEPNTGPGSGPANSMVDAIAALQAKGIAVSPVSLKLLGCTTGPVACTGGLFQNALAAGPTSLVVAFPNTNVSDNYVGKVDFNISEKHRLSTMYWTGNYNGNGQDHGGINAVFLDTFHVHGTTSVTNWIWTPTSSVVNEARFATTRNTFNQTSDDGGIRADGSGGLCTATGCGGKGYPINSGVTSPIFGGLPNINIGPFTFMGTFHNRPSYVGPSPYYVYQDSVSFLRGRHALKVGGEFTHIVANASGGDTGRGVIKFQGKTTNPALITPSNPKGLLTPLEEFFAGTPTSGQLLAGNSIREYDWKAYSAFFQDDWRIKPRLMLNLGIRWEYQTPIREAHNLWGNFDPTLGLVQQGSASVGDSLWKPNNKNFSPRLGIAWDITGKGTTVVRAGASVMYSTLIQGQFGNQLNFQNSHGTSLAAIPTGACKTPVVIGTPCPQTFGGTIQLGTANYPAQNLNWNGVVFPQGGGLSCTASSPCVLGAVDPHLKTPYIVAYNFGVQHVLSNNLSLEVGYVGNHGDRLAGFVDVNQCAPNANGNCVRPYGSAFPYLSFINRQSNQAYSWYNGLQSTLTKRLSHGLSFTAGYTYSHSLDNGSISRFGYLPQNANNPGAEYASGDFDIRHRFTFTTTYALPGKKGFGQLLEGWKLNGIVSLSSPQPWTVSDLSNNFSGSGDNADRWDFFGNPSDFKSGSSSLPYCAGPTDCSVTSGISGIQSNFSAAQSKAMWGQCTAVSPDLSTLNAGGCYVKGNSVMVPPKAGTFGTMGRNLFRDSGFKNVDFSIFKDFKFKERMSAEFRVEFFNVFNHPNIANPWGSQNGWAGGTDLSAPGTLGCGCSTPDVAGGSPLIGSGGGRDMQLGFKFTF